MGLGCPELVRSAHGIFGFRLGHWMGLWRAAVPGAVLQPQTWGWSQGGGCVLLLLSCENLSSQQLVFFTRYLVQLGFYWFSVHLKCRYQTFRTFWHRLGLKIQGLLVEVNGGTSVICIDVGITWIIKQISNVLKFTLQQKYVLKFVYKKYLAWFTLQCLKLLIIKEEKR